MNSSVMPTSGKYECAYVDMDTWIKAFKKLYAKKKTFINTIGYPQTAAHVSKILNIEVPENRVNTELIGGDIMFVCKLEQRVADPSTKGAEQTTPFAYAIVNFK